MAIAGTCTHCNCHGEHCTLPDGDKCAWYDRERTCCNHPACIRAEEATRRRAKAAASASRPRKKYSGWGFGAILDDLGKQRRLARRARRKTRRAS